MKNKLIHALIIALFAAAPALAADSPTPGKKEPKDKSLEDARAAIARQDWSGAQGLMREAVTRDPQNADYHNLYAYSIRKGASPAMDVVFRHYNEALRINPRHRGAHEYIGEAYLMSGNLPKAKEHLAQLDRLCTFGCEEYTKLKKEVAGFEQQHAKK